MTGVNGLISVCKGRNTTGTFFRRGVNGLKKDFKSEFFVLFDHFRKARFINREPFFPALFLKFFCSAHVSFISPSPRPSPIKGEGESFRRLKSAATMLQIPLNPPFPLFIAVGIRLSTHRNERSLVVRKLPRRAPASHHNLACKEHNCT